MLTANSGRTWPYGPPRSTPMLPIPTSPSSVDGNVMEGRENSEAESEWEADVVAGRGEVEGV